MYIEGEICSCITVNYTRQKKEKGKNAQSTVKNKTRRLFVLKYLTQTKKIDLLSAVAQ